MPEFNPFKLLSEKEFANITSIYHSTKKVVALAEKANDNHYVMSCMNELRHVLDHLMRIACLRYDIIDRDSPPITDIKMFCQFNTNKALGHLYRCCSDAYEKICLERERFIDKIRNEYDSQDIQEVIPDFFNRILILVNELKEKSTNARVNKHLEADDKYVKSALIDDHPIDTESEYNFFSRWTECVQGYEGIIDELNCKLSTIYQVSKDRLKREEKAQHQKKRDFWHDKLAKLLIGIICLLLGIFLGHMFQPEDKLYKSQESTVQVKPKDVAGDHNIYIKDTLKTVSSPNDKKK